MSGFALLQHLVQVANRSGSVRPAPDNLLKLKQAIQGVPFQLLQPSMSGVITGQNLVNGIIQAAQKLGGIGEVGQFAGELLQGIAKGAPNLDVGKLVQAVGDGASLGLSLSQFAGK